MKGLYKIHILLLAAMIFGACSSARKSVIKTRSDNVVQRVFVSPPQGQQWSAEIKDTTSLANSIDSLCHFTELNRTSLIGIEVYDLTDSCVVYAHNHMQRMRPASNMKLVTAITALDTLGKDYRFVPEIPVKGWGWCWDDEETEQVPMSEKNETSLHEILKPMLKNSDNIKAECIFYQLADTKIDSTERRDSCAAVVERLMNRLEIDPQQYLIADGSGLSLYNYLSPDVLLRLLKYAYSDDRIYKILYKCLPIAGDDGTLKKRMKETSAYKNVHAKTGTVKGVSSLSGYCETSNHHVLCFSIINQGIENSSIGRAFQDEMCEIMCR